MSSARKPHSRELGPRAWVLLVAIGGGLLLYLGLTAKGGVPDPTEQQHLSHGP